MSYFFLILLFTYLSSFFSFSSFEGFEAMSLLWQKSHKSWNKNNMNTNNLKTCSSFILPVCLENNNNKEKSINLNTKSDCSNLICLNSIQNNYQNKDCFPTPSDNFDYFPPSKGSKECKLTNNNNNNNNNKEVLSPYYGMERGIPPEFSSSYSINLVLKGTVYGNNLKCQKLSNVKIDYWHVDEELFQLNNNNNSYNYNADDLRRMSCYSSIHTDNNGNYEIYTTIPTSYGPPRHINLMITIPGYQSLITRVYFTQDIRLQQFILGRNDIGGVENQNGFDYDYSFPTIDNSRITLRNILSKEPRICDLVYSINNQQFEGIHNIVLKPSSPDTSINNLNGFWYDSDGSIIKVENYDHFFFATQYPHIRSWGSVWGTVRDNIIYGINFRNIEQYNYSQVINEFQSNLFDESKSVISSSSLIGEILPQDSFEEFSQTTEIAWKDNYIQSSSSSSSSISTIPSFTSWHQLSNQKKGYRFIKLEITRISQPLIHDNQHNTNGKLIINEIEFYEGYLSQIEIPPKYLKLKSPRTPRPYKVFCSSFIDQFHHCYKAFDGDETSNSSWITKPSGQRRQILEPIAWIMLDLGIDENNQTLQKEFTELRYNYPTSMKIVCGAENSNSPIGCPMTFSLYGSNEPYENFKLIMSYDDYDYNISSYANGGKIFTFFETFQFGRPINTRCGSCDRPPQYSCSLNSYDSSCESMFCNKDGKCGTFESCPLGQYQSITNLNNNNNNNELPQLRCSFCPEGKYGNTSGLTSQSCSGECDAGCYCTSGSISSCQYQCNDSNYFCPKGSAKPLLATAGMKTIDVNGNTILKRISQIPCTKGHYCQNGIEIPCPPGTYGSDSMLSSSICSGNCQAGFYCPIGTILPIICPLGYYCPDGINKVQCLNGYYGNSQGLKDRECSGKCPMGYYCPEGSKNPTLNPCPAGRYGNTLGLIQSTCSGLCSPGYYCPSGSINSTAILCGSSSFYCPEGSSSPIQVTNGWYTVGEMNKKTLQIICEKGYYCTLSGEKFSCPSGTYGNQEGLFHSVGPTSINDRVFSCSGFCEPGYYCPMNSISSKSILCPAGTYGNEYGLKNSNCTSICPIGYYCPKGSIQPIPCPAGKFGGYLGLKDSYCSPNCNEGICSDKDIEISKCYEGFYCPEGSVSPTQIECGGSEYYCPSGSSAPTLVTKGYFTIGGLNENQRTSQQLCSLGHYCINGIQIPCPAGFYGDKFGLSSPTCSGNCPIGHYCPIGTINSTTYRCPGGRYGSTTNLFDSSCSGVCNSGYYCPEGSTTPTQNHCGSYLNLNNSVYCLSGSSFPLNVPQGYYSLGGNKTTRVMIKECHPGTYCLNGIIYDCPAGRYGDSYGLYSSQCSGLCRIGYYCPSGSTKSSQFPCPRGRLSNVEGLTNSNCAGPCQNPHDCSEL